MTPDKKYSLTSLTVGTLETNCYILSDRASRKTFIIDPGAEGEKILRLLEHEALIPAGIINTHGHADHISANRFLKMSYDIPIYVHADESPYLADPALNGSALFGDALTSPPADVLLKDRETLALGSLTLTVIHTPGHTPGGICLGVEDLLFTGDTLFCGDVGRWDLAGGSEEVLRESLKKFKELNAQSTLLPGHGPRCILEKELQHNPYLLEETE